MNEGDIVTIYDNPITKQNPVGEAELIACVDCLGIFGGVVLFRWEVYFTETGKTAFREVGEGDYKP